MENRIELSRWGAPFLRHAGLSAGLGRGHVDGQSYGRPFHGVCVSREVLAADADLRERCRWLFARMKPGQYFSHSTALELRQVPVPRDVHGEIHVSAHRPAHAPRVAGVHGHRLQARAADWEVVDGLPVAVASEAWAQVLPSWRHDDLVIAGDRLVTPRRRMATLGELQAAAAAQRRQRAAMKVLADIREGSESPRETRLRLLIVRAGLPEPVLGYEIRDKNGLVLARFDMCYPEYGVVVEYDGRQHAEDTAQFERDADRWYNIQQGNWELVRVLNHHLANDGSVALDRIAAALRSRGWTGR